MTNALEISNLSFSYPDGRQVLNNVNIDMLEKLLKEIFFQLLMFGVGVGVGVATTVAEGLGRGVLEGAGVADGGAATGTALPLTVKSTRKL